MLQLTLPRAATLNPKTIFVIFLKLWDDSEVFCNAVSLSDHGLGEAPSRPQRLATRVGDIRGIFDQSAGGALNPTNLYVHSSQKALSDPFH